MQHIFSIMILQISRSRTLLIDAKYDFKFDFYEGYKTLFLLRLQMIILYGQLIINVLAQRIM